MTVEMPCYRSARHRPHTWAVPDTPRRCPGITAWPPVNPAADVEARVRRSLTELLARAEAGHTDVWTDGVVYAVGAIEAALDNDDPEDAA
jgi:hypothetical protein